MKNNILLVCVIMGCGTKILFSQSTECGTKTATVFTQAQDVCFNAPYRLIWGDEFDGNSLSTWNWKILEGLDGPVKSDSKQWYTKNNTIVENGLLRMIVKREDLNNKSWSWWNGSATDNFSWSSSWIETPFDLPYGYGKFEARIKTPSPGGLWPAFWMFGSQWNELDIFEFNDDNDFSLCAQDYRKHRITIHRDYNNDGGDNFCANSYCGIKFWEDFHTYTAIWDPYQIRIYVDGDEKYFVPRYYSHTTGQEQGCAFSAGTYDRTELFCNTPMHLLFNVGVQRGDLEPNTSGSGFPKEMQVEWVRVYYKAICQDIVITDPSQIPQVPGVLNYIYGNNITLNCNYTLPQGTYLTIIGQNIQISPNFNTTGIRIVHNSEPCYTVDPPPIITNEYEGIDSKSITAYPNPANSELFIAGAITDSTYYNVDVYNSIGKLINSRNIFSIDKTIRLEILELKSGVYFLVLTSKNDNKMARTIRFVKI